MERLTELEAEQLALRALLVGTGYQVAILPTFAEAFSQLLKRDGNPHLAIAVTDDLGSRKKVLFFCRYKPEKVRVQTLQAADLLQQLTLWLRLRRWSELIVSLETKVTLAA